MTAGTQEKIDLRETSMSRQSFTIGSRESSLAVIQSEIVRSWLRETYPEMAVDLVTMKTTGDRILDRKLEDIGGKGLFVKELDLALREGRSDLSVHSLKDLPMEVPEDLPVIGYSKREDPRDVLVLPQGKGGEAPDLEIDGSKPIGTSSKRRILQLKDFFPKARFESVRGNVLTRLRKLDEGQYSAIILAAAGLKRLGLEGRISRYFEPDEIIPSAGQGILALQGRAGESYEELTPFCDGEAALAAAAERAFVRALGGGCTSPIAAHAVITGEGLMIRGFYYDEERKIAYRKCLTKEAASPAEAAEAGESLAKAILSATC